MDQDEKFIGYLKYSGKSVEDGFLDTRKSAEALLGFDDILRYFLLKEDPSLKDADFEIPVKVGKGSVIIWVCGIAATAYLTKAAQEAAEKGILNTATVKDAEMIMRGALKAAQWTIKIGSHMGSLAVREFKTGLISVKDQEIEILNENKESLRVPKRYLDIYKECPQKLFSKNAGVIEADRTLELGVFDGEIVEKVCISEKQKSIYYTKNDDSDSGVVLPELKHGQFVELEGVITRVTESTNTIGFDYQGHTLTCKPEEKRLASFKDKIISKKDDHVLPNIKIIGRVDRNAENGEFKEKRPQIIFSNIVTLESGSYKQKLF